VEANVLKLPNFLERIRESYNDADTIGMRAAAIPELWPRKIFNQFHTG